MPGIQITVSPALMGSSHLVQIISVETVPYTLALSRDQLVKDTTSVWDRTPAVILAGTVGWQRSSEAGSPHGG